MAEKRVRDVQAELRRAERKDDAKKSGSQADEDDKPIYRTFSESVGTIAGATLISLPWIFGERVGLIRGRARKLYDDITRTRVDWFPTQKLRETVASVGEVVRHLRELLAQADAPSKFFEMANLSRMAAWATAHPKGTGRYRAAGGSLTWETPDSWDSPVLVKGPGAIVAPSFEPLNAMHEAIAGRSTEL